MDEADNHKRHVKDYTQREEKNKLVTNQSLGEAHCPPRLSHLSCFDQDALSREEPFSKVDPYRPPGGAQQSQKRAPSSARALFVYQPGESHSHPPPQST